MMLFIVLSSLIICYGQTINGIMTGRLEENKFIVTIKLNSDSNNMDLGGATIPINFNTEILSFPDNPVVNVDYIFHNFSDGNYSTAIVTKPSPTRYPTMLWINIDLPYYNNNNGTIVAKSPSWTDVVTLYFSINPNTFGEATWQPTSMFWGIYQGNNSILFNYGTFIGISDATNVFLIDAIINPNIVTF